MARSLRASPSQKMHRILPAQEWRTHLVPLDPDIAPDV